MSSIIWSSLWKRPFNRRKSHWHKFFTVKFVTLQPQKRRERRLLINEALFIESLTMWERDNSNHEKLDSSHFSMWWRSFHWRFPGTASVAFSGSTLPLLSTKCAYQAGSLAIGISVILFHLFNRIQTMRAFSYCKIRYPTIEASLTLTHLILSYWYIHMGVKT